MATPVAKVSANTDRQCCHLQIQAPLTRHCSEQALKVGLQRCHNCSIPHSCSAAAGSELDAIAETCGRTARC
eukprot:6188-Heterococcus_DN1.PRE.2